MGVRTIICPLVSAMLFFEVSVMSVKPSPNSSLTSATSAVVSLVANWCVTVQTRMFCTGHWASMETPPGMCTSTLALLILTVTVTGPTVLSTREVVLPRIFYRPARKTPRRTAA